MELSVVAFAIFIAIVVFTARTIYQVPQQHAYVIERLGKYDRTLQLGLAFVMPFIERVAYRHVLKEILHAMQQQITAEREKRELIAASEGRKQEQINIATGEREAQIQKSEGEKQAAINRAEGQASAILSIADASAEAIRKTALAIREPGGEAAVNLKVAEQYVAAFAHVARTNNTLILPANMADLSGLIASAMTVVKHTNA